MLRLRSISPLLLASPIALVAQITVGPTVHVTKSQPNTVFDEVILGASPTDPNKLVACGVADSHRLSLRHSTSLVYGSTDGGKTWKLVLTPPEMPLKGSTPSAW